MKVLLINNIFFRRGGSEAVFFNTADLLREAGHKVVFFSTVDEKNEHTEDPEYFVTWGNKLKQIRNYFSNPDAANKLEEIIKKEKPDIAHAHLFWGGISPSIFKVLHKYGIPLVHTAHDYRMVCPAYTFRDGKGDTCEKCKGGHYMQCFKNRCSKGSALQSAIMTAEMFYRNRKWHPAEKLDGIIYVSHFSKNKHVEMEPRFADTNNIVLYNCTSVGQEYSPVELDGGYYLFYGRLSDEKGVPTLVEAFKNYPNLTLKIVGTGPKEDELKQKNYKNIEFLGYKTGSELYNYVRNARFVIVPSECYENNPMTIVEAYSMGVPVIGANIGGIPEIVNEAKTGFLFESGNSDSLAKAVDRSLKVEDEEYRQMKRNAIQFAKVNFNKDNYSKNLIDFYERTIRDFSK